MDRTLGSRAKPWLSLNGSEKKKARVASSSKFDSAVDEYELEYANAWFIDCFRTFLRVDGDAPVQPHRLHFLRINWGKSKRTILRELTDWVENHAKAVRSIQHVDKGGRKNQFAAWFTDLAIYRASEAGIPRSVSVKEMSLLFTQCPTKTSASHWEDAQRRTKLRLKHRRDFLKRSASSEKLMRYIRMNRGDSAALNEILHLSQYLKAASPITTFR